MLTGAVPGGFTAVIGGDFKQGMFNGAWTAAFGYLFNCALPTAYARYKALLVTGFITSSSLTGVFIGEYLSEDHSDESVPTSQPDGLTENPDRSGSWGEYDANGKFVERWRLDKAWPEVKRPHGAKDHIHRAEEIAPYTVRSIKMKAINEKDIQELPFHDSDFISLCVIQEENGNTNVEVRIVFGKGEFEALDDYLAYIGNNGAASIIFNNCRRVDLQLFANRLQADYIDYLQFMQPGVPFDTVECKKDSKIIEVVFVSGSRLQCIAEECYLAKR